MKNLLLCVILAGAFIGFNACSGDDEDDNKSIEVVAGQQLTQNVYADEEKGSSGVSFSTKGAWTSSITETTAKSGQKSEVSSTSSSPNWISITPDRGDKGGDYTISINLEPNYTGEKRSVTITIRCNGETIEIKVTQDAITKDGEVPEEKPKGTFNVFDAMTDAAFKEYCEQFDTNNDGILTVEEAEAVTGMSPDGLGISSLLGIEYFTELTILDCQVNSLTSLDVSNNIKLTELLCYNNSLVSLDVSNNTKLTHLDCHTNSLTSLDVSNNTELINLYCSDNSLTGLDISNNTELIGLHCYNNSLTSLDASNNIKLERLHCGYNSLTSLDISNNTELTELSCDYNSLTNLNVSNNTKLEHLDCDGNSLTNLDVSKNTKLTHLYCGNNSLTSLDVSNNTELINLYCSDNSLTSLDISNNTELTDLFCGHNSLTSLDASNNTKLERLYCYNNSLTNLNISKNTELTSLQCHNNPDLSTIWVWQGFDITNPENSIDNLGRESISEFKVKL